MARGETRDDADRRTDVQAQGRRLLMRRALFACGIRQLVTPERSHVQTEVTEDVEGLVEALVGVALVREGADENAPLLEDSRLHVVADAVDVRAVRLREVRLLERGVELDERGADPRVERFDVRAHRPRASLPRLPAVAGGLYRVVMAFVALRLALGLALLVAVGTAAVASGAPVASEKTYIDERGEDVGGPDITRVVVSNDNSGLFTFRLITPNRQRLTQDMRVRLVFTVRGVSYFLLVDPYKPPVVRVALWGCEQQASGLVCATDLAPPLPSLRFRYVRGARFTFDLSELGIEPIAGTRSRITFWANIYSGLRFVPGKGFDFTESHIDRAPSRHPRTFTYVATFGSA